LVVTKSTHISFDVLVADRLVAGVGRIEGAEQQSEARVEKVISDKSRREQN